MKTIKKSQSAFRGWGESMKASNPVTTSILSFAGMFGVMLLIIAIANLPHLLINSPQKAETASQVLGVIGTIGAVLVIYYLSSSK